MERLETLFFPWYWWVVSPQPWQFGDHFSHPRRFIVTSRTIFNARTPRLHFVLEYSAWIRKLGSRVPLGSGHFNSKKHRHLHKNFHSWVKYECSFLCTVDFSNVKFAIKDTNWQVRIRCLHVEYMYALEFKYSYVMKCGEGLCKWLNSIAQTSTKMMNEMTGQRNIHSQIWR